MRRELDIDQFHNLKAQAASVVRLRVQAQAIQERRSIRTFDGFGHFLDAVIGNDVTGLDALSKTVHVSRELIEQLRASELDPLAESFDAIAYIAFLLGVDRDEFLRLTDIDHGRFAKHAETVLARSDPTSNADNGSRIQQLWDRFEEDLASDL